MTTPRQAVAELARLYETYCPLLDQLRMANCADAVVKEEQRQGERIWTLGKIGFGPAGARLHMLKPSPDELVEIADILLASAYRNEAHRVALIGCCVRSRRLGKMLDNAKVDRAPDVMARALVALGEVVVEHGPPKKRGDKARLYRLAAERASCLPDTVKQADRRARKGTVPK